MNKDFLNKINLELIKEIKSKYQFDDVKVLALSEAGKTSVLASLKQFVMKHGTTEVEGILLGNIQFEGSPLQTLSLTNFQKDITEKKLLEAEQTKDLALFSINYIIKLFKSGFESSGNSKDLDGICKFIEIDKKLLVMINSPMAKMFGKFF